MLATLKKQSENLAGVPGSPPPSPAHLQPPDVNAAPGNSIINPHHPTVMAKASNASTASATTPTSPRPSASDLTVTGIPGGPGTIVVGYRGTFAFGRDGLADVKFRKLTRILVNGRVSECFKCFI